MAPGLHGSARTTPRARAELQAAQGTARAPAARYGPSPETVAEWRPRTTTADRPMGPSRPRSAILTEAEEAEVVATFPYAIHTVLTDDGMAFADPPKCRDGPTARWRGHIFDRVCREHGTEHKLTKPCHPWATAKPSG